MAEKLSENEQVANEWREFSRTLAYQKFIEFIETQKLEAWLVDNPPVVVEQLEEEPQEA